MSILLTCPNKRSLPMLLPSASNTTHGTLCLMPSFLTVKAQNTTHVPGRQCNIPQSTLGGLGRATTVVSVWPYHYINQRKLTKATGTIANSSDTFTHAFVHGAAMTTGHDGRPSQSHSRHFHMMIRWQYGTTQKPKLSSTVCARD